MKHANALFAVFLGNDSNRLFGNQVLWIVPAKIRALRFPSFPTDLGAHLTKRESAKIWVDMFSTSQSQ